MDGKEGEEAGGEGLEVAKGRKEGRVKGEEIEAKGSTKATLSF